MAITFEVAYGLLLIHEDEFRLVIRRYLRLRLVLILRLEITRIIFNILFNGLRVHIHIAAGNVRVLIVETCGRGRSIRRHGESMKDCCLVISEMESVEVVMICLRRYSIIFLFSNSLRLIAV